MTEKAKPTPPPPRRFTFKRVLVGLGITVGAVVLVAGAAFLYLVYKATRKFPMAIVDVVPADATLFVESEGLAGQWPDVKSFLDRVRGSRRYKALLRTEPGLAQANLDGAIDSGFKALDRLKTQSGIDPLEAAASYKTCLALYLSPAEGTPPAGEGGGKKGEPFRVSYIAFTFVKGMKVRLAALFAGSAAQSFAPAGAEAVSRDGFTSITRGDDPPVCFAFLQDLLVVSNDEARMAEVLDLAGSGLGSSLAQRPAFRDTMEALPEDQAGLARFWLDFPVADRFLGIRQKAEIKVSTFPFVYIARYVNALQSAVVDLKHTEALAGTLRLDEGARAIVLQGVLRYGGETSPFLERTYGLPPGEPLAASSAPQGTVLAFSLRKDFREFWDQLGYEGDAEARESFLKLQSKHGVLFEAIVQSMGRELTLFFKPSPLAGAPRQGHPPPTPWFCLVARSDDPQAVAASVRGIFDGEIRKYAERAPADQLPVLRVEDRAGAQVTYLDNLPMELKNEVSPDFKPGFFTVDRLVGVFSSLPYAYEVVDYYKAGRTLAAEPAYREAGRGLEPKTSLSFFVDGHRTFQMMQGYRLLLASEMVPLDWDEGKRYVREKYGAVSTGQLEKYLEAWERAVRQKQMEVAGRLARRFENMKILRSVLMNGRYRQGGGGKRPAGIEYDVVFKLDLD